MENTKPQKQKLVSIIVPIYNAEKTLRKALDSLISQTYKNIEIICVNDGSGDNSKSILLEYQRKDKRVKIYTNRKNKGIAYSRNFAVTMANGEYIMWCDSDDYFDEKMVEIMVDTIEKDNTDFAVCETNVVFDENLKERLLLEKFSWAINVPDGKLNDVEHSTFWTLSCVLWNKIFKKNIINKYKIDCPNTKSAEDEAFVYKYWTVSKKYSCVHKKLYNHFRNESGVTSKQLAQKDLDALVSVENVQNFIYKHKIEKFYKTITDLLESKKRYYARLIEKSLKLRLLSLENTLGITLLNFDDEEIIIDDKNYNIFYTIDDKNVEPMIVSMTSIVKNANEDEHFNFYVIYKDISNFESLKEKISFGKHNIKFVKLSDEQIKRLGDLKDDVSVYKFFIPEIAGNLERGLYLDSDTVITSSIHDLYIKKLEKNYIGVVEQAFPSEKKGKITKFINVQNYFNTGVMLLNLQFMKENDLTNKFLCARKNLCQYIKEDITRKVFNMIIEDKFRFIEPKFNLQTEVNNDSKPFWCYTNEEVTFAKEHPVIIHYSGSKKPWNSRCEHLYKDLWFKYLSLSPKKHLCYWKNV